jgi:predicted acyltransferase (DUF342 family)
MLKKLLPIFFVGFVGFVGFGTHASPTVYSGAILTMGENSTVHGDLAVVAAATFGAASKVGGNLVTGGALTLGAGGEVGGDLISGAAIIVGTDSKIKGNLTSLSTVDLGAQASVKSAVTAGTTLALGAFAQIGPDNVLDANGLVVQHRAGTTATIPGTATVNGGNGSINEGTAFTKDETDVIEDLIANRKDQLTEYQKTMSDKVSTHELPVTIVKDRTLTPGVYHATALTTAAGITLKFDAANTTKLKNAVWIINVDTFINLGANLKMSFVGNSNGTIIFNSGSHTAIGAGSELIGTIFANTDITTGAGMKLKGEAKTGLGRSCGGLFSTNGAITLGAGNEIGSEGCKSYFNSPVAHSVVHTGSARRPVNLRAAGEFTILAKAGITNTGLHKTDITGNIGSSPIAARFMDNVYCSEIKDGKIYGVDASYAGGMKGTECSRGNAPAKTLVDNAVLDMGVAYTDAAGRTAPDYSEYGAGKISDGRPLMPGLYKWGTNVVMDKDIRLVGGEDDVWIFQISGNFYQAGSTTMTLEDGAMAKNVFWQLTENVALGDDAKFIGVVLAKTHIALNPLAEVNGRLLSQTQVTLQDNVINQGDEQ